MVFILLRVFPFLSSFLLSQVTTADITPGLPCLSLVLLCRFIVDGQFFAGGLDVCLVRLSG
jgi:hypothetical protein